MHLVRGEAKLRCTPGSFLFRASFALILTSHFSSISGISLLWQLHSIEALAELSTKMAKGSSKRFCEGVEGGKCVVSVKSKLGIGVPSSQDENKVEDNLFILGR